MLYRYFNYSSLWLVKIFRYSLKKVYRTLHKVARQRRRWTCHSSWSNFDVLRWRSDELQPAAWQTSGPSKCGFLQCLTPGSVNGFSPRRWQRLLSPVCRQLPLTLTDSTAPDTCQLCPCMELVDVRNIQVENQWTTCSHSVRSLHKYISAIYITL